jgi:hypothetical protein
VSDKDVFFAKSLEHFLEWFSQSEIERASKARLWMTGFQTQLVQCGHQQQTSKKELKGLDVNDHWGALL